MDQKETVTVRSMRRKNPYDVGNKTKKAKTETSMCCEDDSCASKKILNRPSRESEKKTKKYMIIKAEKKLKNDAKYPELGKSTIAKKQNLENYEKNHKKNTDEPLSKWKDEECLAELENITVQNAKNIIDLFNNDNTIPFILRYRSHLTGELKSDKLRKIKATYEYINEVHEKAKKVYKQLVTLKELTPELLAYIQTARTLEELDFIGSQFKKGDRRNLAHRARQLSLQSPAEILLEGRNVLNLESLVDLNVPELNNIKKVKLGIQHIIADIISKTPEVHFYLEKIYASNLVNLKSEFKEKIKDPSVSKYHLYGNFLRPLQTIKPHQTLAINRGESENELSVKIIIPEILWQPLKNFCRTRWLNCGINYELRSRLFSDSVDDAIKRLLAPLAVRRIKAKLKEEAKNEAICVFENNLRQLLLTPPCSGNVVMGIDPGFKNGCKVAVISPMGSLITYDKFFLREEIIAKNKLKNLILGNKCEIIALGNGTACRETETLLSEFINKKIFKPLNVSYTIISEQAASIYSCSSTALEEFPDLDPTIISAISLARRLQNPLSELVKVEPKHLGVGMYQHDIEEKKLVTALDEIISECVSFVGVDVNSASFYLLKRVAGLNTSKAREIIKYRTEVCSFKKREDLIKVKGIKTKSFLQCAGFLRIVPTTARCTRHHNCQNDFNPLDETFIHPESYETAYKVMDLMGVKLDQLGSEEFIKTIKNYSFSMQDLVKYCKDSEQSVLFILDTLMKPKNFDLRSLSSGSIFRTEIKKLDELSPGQKLEGVVRNIVNFGAFVDIGVGVNGLIHVSQMGNNALQLNYRVNVEVMSVNQQTQRIQLKLISLI